MPMSVPVVRVAIFAPDGTLAPFHLTIFGIPLRDFMIVPGGGNPVYEALHRRGLHGYRASLFGVTGLAYPGPSPRRAPPEPTPPPPPPDPVVSAIARQEYRAGRRSYR